ncbi:ABC transporter ATP-binding protein [Streptomyces sp. NBC_01477]|uniref:ABC transporter ATP-binding protein n=1 Tax=Streptomyces sp. NBC_01477 TaxID=2976015 RepID=UPI002E341E33|nr:ABC transporter ATP-binding protein [Streptomyces sp. NBC_01477]
MTAQSLLLRHARLAGRRSLALCTGLLVLAALMPTAVALATGFLITDLVREGARGTSAGAGSTAAPLLALTVCLVVLQVATSALGPAVLAAERRIDGRLRQEILGRIGSLATLDQLEAPELQQDLEQFRTGAVFWMGSGIGAGALAQVQQYVNYAGLVFPALALSHYRWWWGPAALLVCLTVRTIDSSGFLGFERVHTAALGELRRVQRWRSLLADGPSAKEVRVFGIAAWLLQRHDAALLGYSDTLYEARRRLSHRQVALFAGVAAVCTGLLLAVAERALHGGLPAGGVAAVLGAFGAMLIVGDNRTAMLIETSVPMAYAVERIRAATTVSRTVPRPAAGAAGSTTRPPSVAFHHVGFRYPGTDRPVLADVDLELRPGEILAVVGVNGAGKSTLGKLLTGLYRPTSGTVTVDDRPLEDLDPDGWARQVYAVHQHFGRYPLTVTDNLRAAAPGATPAQIRAAADRTAVTELIDRLPRGWDTVLAQGYAAGQELSGGQWQRIALTRAFLAVATGVRVLLLDEPTANLDIRAELAAFELIRAAGNGASVLLISHRFATVRQADRIAVLDAGRVVELGTHRELLAARGRYATMFTLQASAFDDPGQTQDSPPRLADGAPR